MSELASSNAHLSFWPATRHDTLDSIGPREVNLNYYPTWPGADHAIILKIDAAEHMGVLEALSHPRASDVRNSCPPQPVLKTEKSMTHYRRASPRKALSIFSAAHCRRHLLPSQGFDQRSELYLSPG